MRMKKLTGRKLAELTGYTNVYISMVLGGSRNSQEECQEQLAQAEGDPNAIRNAVDAAKWVKESRNNIETLMRAAGCSGTVEDAVEAMEKYWADWRRITGKERTPPWPMGEMEAEAITGSLLVFKKGEAICGDSFDSFWGLVKLLSIFAKGRKIEVRVLEPGA